VQRFERHRQRDRAAVRVREDPGVLARPAAIDLRNDERDAVLEPVRRRLVDDDGPSAESVRDELA
jgi:hypothetical protein